MNKEEVMIVKILNMIKSFILGVLGCVFFVFAISMTILLLNYNKYGLTQFGNTTLVIISDFKKTYDYQSFNLVESNDC